MSMLTPPGLSGKKYRVTGERYPRMRRPRRGRRVGLAAVAALAVLGLLGYGTWQLVDVFRGDDGAVTEAASPEEPPVECEAEAAPVPIPEPDTVTVNVYNTSDRSGLAQETADALSERGFTIGEVDNAPEELESEAPPASLLLGSDAASESGALALLGSHLTGSDGVETAGTERTDRADGEIDLLLGEDFADLANEDEVSAALTALSEPAARDDCDDETSADQQTTD